MAREPTWDDNISKLFTDPYWIIDPQDRTKATNSWHNAMLGYNVDLHDYQSVCEFAGPVYCHLNSRQMPIPVAVGDIEYFPLEACEDIRLWYNQGLRKTVEDPINVAENPIPKPSTEIDVLRKRKDIRALTQQELDHYRMQLEDVLKVGDPSPQSLWQILGNLHGDWCLHYQEAFLPWHRANLLYVEKLIDCSIPYWNWYAEDISDPESPLAGIPQPFLDETYIHPQTNRPHPNPLRFACAKGGISKAIKFPEGGYTDFKHINRFPYLVTPRSPDHQAKYKDAVSMMCIFTEQVTRSLEFELFSAAQGRWAYPWANIPAFVPPQADALYKYRDQNFDGLYEQAHDNYHGWIGPDMADNAYTAFDPIFYSLHSNIDRIFERFLRKHPAQQFTSAFPIKPFAGPFGQVMALGDPREYIYTTIGDMVKSCRSLGYTYGPPVSPDADSTSALAHGKSSSTIGLAIRQPKHRGDVNTHPDINPSTPLVVFHNVKCNKESYSVDIFVTALPTSPQLLQPISDNPTYFGRMTLLGMGDSEMIERCIREGIQRTVFPRNGWKAVGKNGDLRLYLVVREISSGTIVPEEKYHTVNGLEASLEWRHGISRERGSDECKSGDCRS